MKTKHLLLILSTLALAAIFAPCAKAAPIHEVLYSFQAGPTKPFSGLIQATDGNFYGTSSDGGGNAYGTVFKVTPAGVLTTLVHFTGYGATNKGANPYSGVVEGSDGNFYGTTYGGGANFRGTVFKMTPAGVLTTLVEFTGNGATNKGAYPSGLVQASDGNFYGTTSDGGTPGFGTVFKMTPAGVLTTLVEFTGNGATNKGSGPFAALVQGSDGNLYGTTHLGGASDYGTVFKMTPAGVLTTLVEFTPYGGTNKGRSPQVALVQGSDGNFYGTTNIGGTSDYGTVFKMTPAGVLTTLVYFTRNGATNKGAEPNGLVQGSDGNFYGTTYLGGASDYGTVFRMTPAGVLTTLVEFTGNGATNKGSSPHSGLVEGSDGNFYGTTPYTEGNGTGLGTVFKMTPAGVLTTLVKFTEDGATNKGRTPRAALVQGSGGNFYGTTDVGGTSSFGTVFQITPAGVLTTLVEFTGNGATNKGSSPQAELVQGSDGNFYGTTNWTDGPVSGFGTVFKMTPAGVLTTLVKFTRNGGTNKGAYPNGLVQGSDGNFYGTTNIGGANDSGTVFKMTSAGVLTTLVAFTGNGGTKKGSQPQAALVQGTDGNFYGTTSVGGTNGGTVFKMTPAGALTTLVEFTGNGATNKGAYPRSAVVQGSDGNFYGTTFSGGANGQGTVFKMTPAGVLTTLVEFTGNGATNKGNSPAALVQGSDGNFYGTTYFGGTGNFGYGFGTVFKMTPAGVLTTLVEFTDNGATNKGSHPSDALVQGSDGNLYGTTLGGGSGGGGTVFRMRFGPTPATLAASGVAFNGATLNGSVNPEGLPTTVHFEYGLTTAYGTSTASQNIGAGTSAVPVQALLSGLAPNTTYHYRLVATNSNGTDFGVDQTFTTLVDASVVGTWAERTVVRNLPQLAGGAVEIGTLTFTGGTGSIEAAVNAIGTGWSVAKRYVIPIRYNLGNGSPPGTWLKVLPTHDTEPYGVNNFDLDIKVSGATALLRLRTVGSNGAAATARIAIKTTGLQTFANSSFTAPVEAPLQTIGGNAVDEVKGKAGIGAAPSANAVLDINGGDTRGLHLRPRSVPGAPTTGTWNQGTIILDSGANLYICTVPGTPGTWKNVGN